ncbi:MAG: glpgli family protein, partial [Bacteroidales bacterium]|nr:glpgli family protein [Bacteroidales bacterium]
MKSILTCIALLIVTVGAQAQVNVKKLKKAEAIEVSYQSSYKGQTRPGGMVMRVFGSQVALENIQPSRPAEMPNGDPNRPKMKQPVQKSYMDYAENKSFRYAELPDGRCISTTVPFT